MAGLLRTRVICKTIPFKNIPKLNLSLYETKCQYHFSTSYFNIKKGKLVAKRLEISPHFRFQSTVGLGKSTPQNGNGVGESSFETNSLPATETIGVENGLLHAEPTSETSTFTTTEAINSENGLVHSELSLSENHRTSFQSSEIIPDPPPIPQFINEEIFTNETTVELSTSLVSQGLGGWFPPGIMQECLNFLHVNLDLPWFLAIFTGTVVVRVLLFPLVIKGQKNAAHMSNHMPQLHALQAKMTEARKVGNPLEAAHYGQEMMEFMKEKKVNPVKAMILPLVQAPIFISFFIGLRQMANLPMESMKEGGIYWFTNLTVADPYYILPILTSLTLLATIELGADGLKSSNLAMAKYIFRAMPFLMIPFTINFPAAVLCYWLSSNIVSLVQVGLLKIPRVRVFFNIPKVVPPPINKTVPKKGFVESVKESMKNAKITREMEERARLDEIQFKKSGLGPIPKTYAYDPTKQNVQLPKKAILVKKREH